MKPSDKATLTFNKKVGARIVAARDKRGWKPRHLLAAVGAVLSPSRLSNYESGRRGVDPWVAHLLANALGVSASFLLCLEDEERPMLTPEEEKLLRYFRALPENERDQTAKHIEVNALRYLKTVPDRPVEHVSARGKAAPAQKKRSPASAAKKG